MWRADEKDELIKKEFCSKKLIKKRFLLLVRVTKES